MRHWATELRRMRRSDLLYRNETWDMRHDLTEGMSDHYYMTWLREWAITTAAEQLRGVFTEKMCRQVCVCVCVCDIRDSTTSGLLLITQPTAWRALIWRQSARNEWILNRSCIITQRTLLPLAVQPRNICTPRERPPRRNEAPFTCASTRQFAPGAGREGGVERVTGLGWGVGGGSEGVWNESTPLFA